MSVIVVVVSILGVFFVFVLFYLFGILDGLMPREIGGRGGTGNI